MSNLIGSGLNLLVCKAIQNQNVVGLNQRSRFLVLTKRSAASGDENVSDEVELKRVKIQTAYINKLK